MSEQTTRGFAELTPEEAKALGGNSLTIPKDGVVVKTITFGKGTQAEREVEEASWDEVVILDGIEPQGTKEERFVGYPTDERYPEVWAARYHISQTDAETENGGKRVTDFMEFIYDLATIDRTTLEDYAKRYKGTQDPKRFWFSRFIDLSGNLRKMATILKEAGHADRLANGQFFTGFGSCFDILPAIRGTKFLVKVKQVEDKNGVPRDSVASVRPWKGM